MSQQPMTEAERQELLLRYKDLQTQAEALAREAQRPKVRSPARLALAALVVLGIGVAVYVATESVLWALLGTVIGVPVVVLAGVMIVATVQHSAAERERKSQVPLGKARVIADPRKALVRLTEALG